MFPISNGMKSIDAFKTAWKSLTSSKTRSFLTMLGIVIGITSVILLMSLGSSAQKLIIDQVQGVGSNLIFIVPGGSGDSRFASPASVQGIIIKTLVARDIENLRQEPSIDNVVPEVRGQAKVVFENNSVETTYEGVSGEFFEVRDLDVQRGVFFTKRDEESFNKVTVIGSELANKLFGQRNPIGKTIRIKNINFQVVGVLEKKGLGPLGIDQDLAAIIPVTVAQKQLLGIDYYNLVTVQAKDVYNIDYSKERIISVLRLGHRITDSTKDDFTVRTQEDALDLLGNITGILTAFLTAIASISLIVGGIGIMNIMLVSVIERTREIGLRKAIGATNGDIMKQFLFEAIILTVLGALIGIFLGAFFVTVIYFVLVNTLSTGWFFSLPASAIVISVVVATITGILFGLYPARKAALKNPIDALRYE